MMIVGANLVEVVRQLSICDVGLAEEFSLRIRLDSAVRIMLPYEEPIYFGANYDVSRYFEEERELKGNLELSSTSRVLACSSDEFKMPLGYFGLVQTKGSLARLFVSATCNDGQIEPGYAGKITLEIINHASFPVHIPVRSDVAQMFLFRCSTKQHRPYAGRYQNAKGPTFAKF